MKTLYAAIALLAINFSAPVTASADVQHAIWADDLVAHIQPQNNEYASNPSVVTWAGYSGAAEYKNRSVCSTFVTRLLMQSYQLTASYFNSWMGSSSPDAATYHDVIVAENRFMKINNISQLQVGDIIAIKYPAGSDVSGHAMVVDGLPKARIASAPVVNGTVQYELAVIDSSKSGHGAEDTRKMADGSWDTGVGRGIMRLYANSNGQIVGHTWSTYSNSLYYDQNARHLVVGRLAL